MINPLKSRRRWWRSSQTKQRPEGNPPSRARFIHPSPHIGNYTAAAQQTHSHASQVQLPVSQHVQSAAQSHVQSLQSPHALLAQQAPAEAPTAAMTLPSVAFFVTEALSAQHDFSQVSALAEAVLIWADLAAQQTHSQASPHRQSPVSQQRQPSTQSHVQVSHKPQALPLQHPPTDFAAAAPPPAVNTIPTADNSVRPANKLNFANIVVFLRKTFQVCDDRLAIAWRDSRPPGNHPGKPPIPSRSTTGNRRYEEIRPASGTTVPGALDEWERQLA